MFRTSDMDKKTDKKTKTNKGERTPLLAETERQYSINHDEQKLKYSDYSMHAQSEEKQEEDQQIKHEEAALTLSDIIFRSPFTTQNTWLDQVVKAFNNDNKESFVTSSSQFGSYSFGKAIPQNQFWLVERNNQVQLVPPSLTPMRTKIYPSGGVVKDHGYYSQTSLIIGKNNRYIVNVPQGKIAKAWVGMRPILLGEGTHVIKEANFRLATDIDNQPATSLVNANQAYIHHGNFHILRVPQGKIAKVWLNGQAIILTARPEPYVFNDNTFSLLENRAEHFENNFQSVTDRYIHHGNRHILRVPQGEVAKVWIKGQAILLREKDEPYEFNDATFQLDKKDPAQILQNYQRVSDVYIRHGNFHFLRVPQGKYAKVWIRGEAKLLEPSQKPYEFDDPTFRIDQDREDQFLVDISSPYIRHGNTHIVNVPKGKIAKITERNVPKLLEGSGKPYRVDDDPYFELTLKSFENNKPIYFFDTTEQLIVHGHIKRVKPHTGEVAVTYKGSQLEIIKDFTVLENANDTVIPEFFQTLKQTLVFPSEATKKQRQEMNKDDSDYINYEIYRTSDGLPLGVNLVVVYSVTDPQKALQNFKPSDIVPHIERMVETDMAQIIQAHKSTEFLNTNLRMNKKDDHSTHTTVPSAPLNLTDEIAQKLKKDFEDIGIELNSIRIDTPKILDKKVNDQINGLALTTIQNQANSIAAEQQLFVIRQNAENASTQTATEAQLTLAKKQAELQQAQKDFEIQKTRIETENAKLRMQAQAAMENEAAKSKMQAQTNIEIELAKADGEIKKAEKEREVQRIKNETKMQALEVEIQVLKRKQEVELEKERKLAELLQNNPNYLQLRAVESMSTSLKGIQSTIISPEVANSLYIGNNSIPSFTFFGGRTNQSTSGLPPSQPLSVIEGQKNIEPQKPVETPRNTSLTKA